MASKKWSVVPCAVRPTIGSVLVWAKEKLATLSATNALLAQSADNLIMWVYTLISHSHTHTHSLIHTTYHHITTVTISHTHYSHHITTVTISLQSPSLQSHITTVTISLQSPSLQSHITTVPYTLLQCPHFRWDAQSTANTLGAGHTLPQSLLSLNFFFIFLRFEDRVVPKQTGLMEPKLTATTLSTLWGKNENVCTCVCMVSDWMIVLYVWVTN